LSVPFDLHLTKFQVEGPIYDHSRLGAQPRLLSEVGVLTGVAVVNCFVTGEGAILSVFHEQVDHIVEMGHLSRRRAGTDGILCYYGERQ
jgi:hypothetical protein